MCSRFPLSPSSVTHSLRLALVTWPSKRVLGFRFTGLLTFRVLSIFSEFWGWKSWRPQRNICFVYFLLRFQVSRIVRKQTLFAAYTISSREREGERELDPFHAGLKKWLTIISGSGNKTFKLQSSLPFQNFWNRRRGTTISLFANSNPDMTKQAICDLTPVP
jgi:hypothetical protein